MIYKSFKNTNISLLGMGTMRLPVNADNDCEINYAEVEKMVALAMREGINYFDTAWGYHDGEAEKAIGRALSAYPRKSYMLADKFPGYDLGNMARIEEIFEQQLKKCGVEYFDFYLFHNVCELNIDSYLNPKYKILEYLQKQKQNGRIRHLGFSAHGSIAVIKKFLEAYGKEMEFGQLQFNYLDSIFQDAVGKAALLNSYRIPIWVMEPLRGGQLSKLSDDDEKALHALRPDESVSAWAFRYLQSFHDVTVVLSGMSDCNQLEENIKTFSESKPLSDTEMKTLMSVAENMLSKRILPCTACRYCINHCPQKLDIPSLISLFNEHSFTGGGFLAPMTLATYPEEKRPSACIGCKSCEAVCPQQLKISEAMSTFSKMLGN